MLKTIDDAFYASLADSMKTDLANLAGTSGSLKSIAMHGTTIGAFLIGQGEAAILFCDGKISMGNTAFALDFPKNKRIDRHTCMLLSGAAGPGMAYAKALRTQIEFIQDSENVILPARVKANFLKQLLRENMGLSAQGMACHPILASYDTVDHQAIRLFVINPDGSDIVRESSAMLGSGANGTTALVEMSWHPGLTQEEGVALVRDVREGAKADNFTGGTWVLWRLDADGVSPIEEWPDE